MLQDITAGGAIGAFFASLRLRLRLVEILVPLLVSAYLGSNPGSERFALPIAFGLVATAASNWAVRNALQNPVALPSVGLLLRLRLAGRGKSVRRYIWFIMLCSLYMGLLIPFWLVILKQRGMSDLFLVAMFPFRALGHMMGLRLWGKIVDSHNYRPVLELSVVIMVMLGFSWFSLPPSVQTVDDGQMCSLFGLLNIPATEIPLIVWAMAFHLIWGFAEGGWMMGQTKAMLDSLPEVYQADGFTLSMFSGAIAVAVGSFIGGLCFQGFTNRPTTFAGFDLRVVFLAFAQLSMLAILITISRLTGHDKQISTSQLMAALWHRKMSR